MRKRIVVAVLILLSALLGGCWNYRGLNEMSITTGIAVDRDAETGLFHLTFEIVDLTEPVKQIGITSALIDSEGKTIFDAARNAKKRIVSKLYFGHTEMVVFSDELLRSMDISSLIDFFLRDAEIRQTMCVVVSQEPTARDLLTVEGLGNPLVAYEIQGIIEEDQRVTSSTVFMELFELYNTLNSEGLELTLPVFHKTLKNDIPASEANGIAVFKGERLVGYLTPDESKYFLFVKDMVKGGVITFSSKAEEPVDTTLEISESRTKLSFDYKEGQLTINIETETDTFLNESDERVDALDKASIQALEDSASKEVMRGISDMIERVRTDYSSDIFGFGNMIYRQDYKLWQQLKDRWDEMFPQLSVNVKCKVNIVNTALLKKA